MSQELRRPDDNSMIAGVCGGLAESFDIDATIVRLAWVALALVSSGTVIALYLLAWWLMPDERGQRAVFPLTLLVVFVVLPALCVFACGVPAALLNLFG